jgi:hypothetical protein
MSPQENINRNLDFDEKMLLEHSKMFRDWALKFCAKDENRAVGTGF